MLWQGVAALHRNLQYLRGRWSRETLSSVAQIDGQSRTEGKDEEDEPAVLPFQALCNNVSPLESAVGSPSSSPLGDAPPFYGWLFYSGRRLAAPTLAGTGAHSWPGIVALNLR